jgi:hypothetical protein
MTLSLKERLAERLESQSAEIETMTAAELKRLAVAVQRHATSELERTKSDIRDQNEKISATLRQFSWIKSAVIGTWACLIVSLALTGFLVWRSTVPQMQTATLPMFTDAEGRSYVVLPLGSQTSPCHSRTSQTGYTCVELPRPEGT